MFRRFLIKEKGKRKLIATVDIGVAIEVERNHIVTAIDTKTVAEKEFTTVGVIEGIEVVIRVANDHIAVNIATMEARVQIEKVRAQDIQKSTLSSSHLHLAEGGTRADRRDRLQLHHD